MISQFEELFRFRDLLVLWTFREIKVRYKQSILGAAWAILQPLALMVVFTVIFSLFARVASDDIPYPIFSYTGLLPWTFFATSVSLGVPSLINNMNLVTKTYFPREILPLGSIGASLFDFLIASSIFFLLLTYYGISLTPMAAWIPFLVVTQIVLTLGVTLLGAALLVFYRDVRFVVPLGIQIWMFASPVIYPLSLVPEPVRPFYLLNPMAGIIDGYRSILLLGIPPDLGNLMLSSLVSVSIFIVGYLTFKRLEWSFADVI